MAPKVAIYTRISQDRQHEELATDRQEESCRHICAGRGWEVVGVYKDVDVSAYKANVKRPDYGRLLMDIEAGRLDGVVIWKLDRLVRRITEFSKFWAVCDKAGVFVKSATQPLDTSDPTGLGLVFMLVGLAETESKTRSDRLKAKHAQLAKQGKGKGGGTRPFGFAEDRVSHNAAEKKLIKDAARRVLKGQSLRSICTTWNEQGVATVSGTAWTTSVLRNLLVSPRIAGLREHKGEIVRDDAGQMVEAEWKPILDRDMYFRVVAILLDPARNAGGGRPGRKYLLTGGLAFCGLCGERLVARPKGDGRPCYVCASGIGFKGCGKIRQLAHPLEELVVAKVMSVVDVIDEVNATAALPDETVDKVEKALRSDQQVLEQLSRDYYVDKVISREEFLAARAPLEERVEQLGARMVQLKREAPPTFAELASRASALDLEDPLQVEDWRKLIRSALHKVVLKPAIKGQNFFNSDRVEFVWREDVERALEEMDVTRRAEFFDELQLGTEAV